jgi:hypothetical protein
MTDSIRETAENYQAVIHRSGDWRIAPCRDGIQWLFQRRRPGFKGVGPAWDNLSYLRTRTALIRVWTVKTGDDGDVLLHLLTDQLGSDR